MKVRVEDTQEANDEVAVSIVVVGERRYRGDEGFGVFMHTWSGK